MIKKKFFLLSFFYFFLLFFLMLYSYSQVDLNLTLSSWEPYQVFQRQMTQLGYFNRSLSGWLWLFLAISLFIFYLLIIDKVKNQQLSFKKVKTLIIFTGLILFFSYPAFSHDIFNYIFDARILLLYHLSPWQHTAQDFPFDLWTRFMHWTHRTFPYGPGWLLLSLPFYLLGFGKFVLTLFSFKLLCLLSYYGSGFIIYKILAKKDQKKALTALVFFCFNPLVVVEGILSPHLDMVMTFFGLLGIWLYLEKRNFLSFLSFLFSVSIKYVTVSYLIFWLKNFSFLKKIWLAWFVTLGIIIVQILLREILPWYFLPLLALSSLSLENRLIKNFSLGLSLGGVLYYFPYLFYGDYTLPVKELRYGLFFLPITLFLLFSFCKRECLKKTN